MGVRNPWPAIVALAIPACASESKELLMLPTAGIGVRIQRVKSRIVVVSTLPQGPASKAAVAKGDTIISVGGQRLADKTLKEAVELLRGEAGTPVELVLRTTKGQTKPLRLMRASLSFPLAGVLSKASVRTPRPACPDFVTMPCVCSPSCDQMICQKGCKYYSHDDQGNCYYQCGGCICGAIARSQSSWVIRYA
jgi:hypothetical protein